MTVYGRWFKFYHEWCTDPKVQRLSEVDQRRMVMIFCFCCRGDRPDLDAWAFSMRVKPGDLRATCDRLTACGVLDKDLRVRNWDRRQGKSERQRQHEKRIRDREASPGVTLLSRDSHVTVTEKSRLDSDSDSDKRRKESPHGPPVGGGHSSVDSSAPVQRKPPRRANVAARAKWDPDIATAKDLWVKAAEAHGTKWTMGGGVEDCLARQFERDGGSAKALEAIARLAAHKPRQWLLDRCWSLAWLCKTTDAHRNPVNRMDDILEGILDDEDAKADQELESQVRAAFAEIERRHAEEEL